MNATPPREAPESAADRLSSAAARANKKLRHATILVVVVIVIGVIAGIVPRRHHRNDLLAENTELAVQTVNVTSPAPGKAAPGLTLSAEIKALVEAPIYARASGYLKRWLVDIGANVKEGDLLAEIDTPDLDQELAQARAQLAQAEAALALAKTTAARWADLVKTASVSEQEAAEKDADLQLKTATVEAAKANVHKLEDLQGFQKVTAPFAGIITARKTDVGELIAANNGKELFRLAQTGTLRVYVRVPQSVARGISPGQKAELTIAELPGRVFSAQVVRTSGAIAPDSRTLLTELEVKNPKGEILAGTYGQVRFTEARMDAPMTLPSSTVLFRPEGPKVATVAADGKVELRDVKLGRDFGQIMEILEGVDFSDRIVLSPPDSLVGGIAVKIAEAQTKAPKRE
jgi:RND family efflux transporter MFP subunit